MVISANSVCTINKDGYLAFCFFFFPASGDSAEESDELEVRALSDSESVVPEDEDDPSSSESSDEDDDDDDDDEEESESEDDSELEESEEDPEVFFDFVLCLRFFVFMLARLLTFCNANSFFSSWSNFCCFAISFVRESR